MSLSTLIHHRIDWALFIALAWGLFFLARQVLGRLGCHRKLGTFHASVIGAACACAFLVTDWIGGRERERMQAAVSNLAPAYARELQELGHGRLPIDASPESPLYRSIVEAEQRWRARNPAITKVFTFRFDSGGNVVYIVDAPCDRNVDGRLVGEHELAHAIGSGCVSAGMEMLRALCGVSTFQARAFDDEWGTWVRAFEPIRDETGRVEAGVAVEFDAREWVAGEAAMRLGVLGTLLVALLVHLAATTATLLMRAEVDRRREIESELRRGEERLRAILDHDPDFVGLVGPDGNLLEVNPAGVRMVGAASKEQLLGHSLEAALTPVQPERLRSLHRPARGAAPASVEYQIKSRAGEPRWVQSHAVALGPRFGLTSTFLVVTRDIHDEKVAREQAERLQKELVDASRAAGMAEIATGVLHNIGNVINTANIACSSAQAQLGELSVDSLRMLANILSEQEDDLPRFFAEDARAKRVTPLLLELTHALEGQRDDLRRELETLTRALDHVKGVIHSQQTLARSSTVYELVDPREIVEEALNMNAEAIHRHGLRIEREYAQTIPLQLDRHKLLLVLINLITNAKEAVKDCPPERRRLRMVLATQRAGGRLQVVFEVRDTGVGIETAHLTRIFSHGFSTRPGGHGFGLHSSVLAAREMGGDLTAHSDGPGRGATFRLRVPAQARTDMVAA